MNTSVRKAACIGAGLTGSLYLVIGFSAARCALNGGASVWWSIGTVVVFSLFGLGLGAFLGAFNSRVEAEQKTKRHFEDSRRGVGLAPAWSLDRL